MERWKIVFASLISNCNPLMWLLENFKKYINSNNLEKTTLLASLKSQHNFSNIDLGLTFCVLDLTEFAKFKPDGWQLDGTFCVPIWDFPGLTDTAISRGTDFENPFLFLARFEPFEGGISNSFHSLSQLVKPFGETVSFNTLLNLPWWHWNQT